MAKMLRTAAIVVGVVALAATGIGLAIGGAAAAGAAATASTATFLGMSGATLMTVGAIASVASGLLSIGASLMASKIGFGSEGNALSFQTNPQSGLPYAIGRTRMSGIRIFAETSNSPGYTKAQDLLFFGALLTAGGQIGAIESFTADNEAVSFDGSTGNAFGTYANWMAQKVWTGGLMASALALALNGAAVPAWGSTHRLSGMTHALWGLRYDTNGEKFSAGVPEPAWVGRWVKVYDPRLDSTYPGGSGSCRILQEDTYVWSRNPALHALTWSLGRWQNGKRTLGIGAPPANIRIADFVTAANVADANKWTCGGVEFSTDSKWDVLKRMLQAGGAIPTMTGAMIGCRVNAPRISVATITAADLLDGFSFSATKPRRERFNTVIPRYRSEAHDWQVISGRPISVASLVMADGGMRQKEMDFPLVQLEVGQGDLDGDLQAGQLSAYAIMNSREAGPIHWTTGPRFIGLKSGDCVTIDIPDEGMVAQPVIINSVSVDPSTGKITFAGETETDAKHAFALGESAVPPPPYALTPPNIVPPTPTVDAWGLGAALDNNGMPFLTIYGDLVGTVIDSVLVQYRRTDAADWSNAGTIIVYSEDVVFNITGVDGGVDYEARIAYRNGDATGPWRLLAAVTTPVSLIAELSDELADLEADTAAALATANAAQAAAEAAEAAIIEAGGEITTLTTLVESQGVSITENATAISNAVGDLADLTVTVGTLGSTVSSQATAISTLALDAASLETLVAAQGSSIATNSSAISTLSSSVATLETVVTSGSPNLLANGSFEAGQGRWTTPSLPVSFASNGYWGRQAIYHGALTGGPVPLVVSEAVPLAPGVTYTLSGDLLVFASSTDAHAYLDVIFFNSADEIILDSGQNPVYAVADFSNSLAKRQAGSITETAPAGTAYGVVRVIVVPDGATITAVGARQIKLERGSVATRYSAEATITQAFQSVDGNFARYSITLDVNGFATGFENYTNGQTSNFVVRADRFAVANGTGVPFEVIGGQTRLSNVMIGNANIDNLSVNTIKIANQAVNDPGQTAMLSNVTVNPGYQATLMSLTKTRYSTETDILLDVTLFIQTNDDLNAYVRIESTSTHEELVFDGYDWVPAWVPNFIHYVPIILGGTGPGILIPFSFSLKIFDYPTLTETWNVRIYNQGGSFVNALIANAGSNLIYTEVKK
jgi:hypothetical protein